MTGMSRFQKTIIALIAALVVVVGIGAIVVVSVLNQGAAAAKEEACGRYPIGSADYFYCLDH